MRDDEAELPVPTGWEDNWKLAFPKEYLGAEHLRGQDVTLTISRVHLPSIEFNKPGMRPRKERRLVVEFDTLRGRTDGTPFRWMLNKTNSDAIAQLYGPAPRSWVGKRITLWPDPDVMMPNPKGRGQVKGTAIRVRPAIPPERGQQRPARESPATLPPAGDAPAAAGAPDEDELREIAAREREENS
jgi:hypothetical protein